MKLDPSLPDPWVDAIFALLEADDGTLSAYWHLACETSSFLKAEKERRPQAVGDTFFGPERAKRAIASLSASMMCEQSSALVDRWHQWDTEFQLVERRSPKWRLKQMVIEISESHAFLTWPKRWERLIWEWALSPYGSTDYHFDDRDDVMNEDFHGRLHALVLECDGFLYRCEETHHIIFAPTEELPAIWRHQDHLAAIDRDKRFGFVNDALRPDCHLVGREPTEAERRIISEMPRRRRPARGWRRMFRWLNG